MSVKTYTGTLHVLECAECHMTFGIPSSFRKDRERDHKSFYCPGGHSNYYPQETEEERLRSRRSRNWRTYRCPTSTKASAPSSLPGSWRPDCWEVEWPSNTHPRATWSYGGETREQAEDTVRRLTGTTGRIRPHWYGRSGDPLAVQPPTEGEGGEDG